jgi:putative redox protein
MSTQSSGAPLPTTTHPAIEVEWVGGQEFEAGRAGGPRIHIDGDSRAGPSPFDVLLASVATCSAIDVVAILQKQRTPVRALRVRVEARRVETTPRRLAAAVLHFSIAAPGATAGKAARAVELSVTRYCSVRSSLIAGAPVTWTIELTP